MSHRLRHLQPFFPKGTALGKHAQLSMAHGEPGAAVHGGQDDQTDTVVAPHPL